LSTDARFDVLVSLFGQVEHFREAFNLFDTDGGGSIDIEELGSCLRSLGKNLNEQELSDMIAEYDQENTGVISFDGFLDMIASQTADLDVDKEMVAAFCEFDTACVGRLDRQTFCKILSGWSSDEEDDSGSWMERLVGGQQSKISLVDVDKMLDRFQCVDPVTQEVDYARFVHRLMMLE
jgi:Ca2+-binding EF-hand superfamily protein